MVQKNNKSSLTKHAGAVNLFVMLDDGLSAQRREPGGIIPGIVELVRPDDTLILFRPGHNSATAEVAHNLANGR